MTAAVDCWLLTNMVLLQLDNLHIRVDRAGQTAHGGTGGNVVYERNRTVFVGNLPFDVEASPLQTYAFVL